MKFSHDHLLRVMVVLPTDYADFGGDVQRWAKGDDSYPDCSCGCRWALWQKGQLGSDWCVCVNPVSPRKGLLTFEHQAGHGCFASKGRSDDPPKVKRRSYEDRRFGGGCDARTSPPLAEDYRDPDRQGQDSPLISEDGQSAHVPVGLPRSAAAP
jgi:hypothetical protein